MQSQKLTDFKSQAAAEWSRLTPQFPPASRGIRDVFESGFREGWNAYFAPLRMIGWLARYGQRRYRSPVKMMGFIVFNVFAALVTGAGIWLAMRPTKISDSLANND